VKHHAITLNCPPFPWQCCRGGWVGLLWLRYTCFSVYLDCQRPALGLSASTHFCQRRMMAPPLTFSQYVYSGHVCNAACWSYGYCQTI